MQLFNKNSIIDSLMSDYSETLNGYTPFGVVEIYNGDSGNIKELAEFIYKPFSSTNISFTNPADWITNYVIMPMHSPSGYTYDGVLTAGDNISNVKASILNISKVMRVAYFNATETIFNNSLDFTNYAGYIKIKMYLPFYGYVDLNPNECINYKYIHIFIKPDFITGQACYIICGSNSDYPNIAHPPNYLTEDDMESITDCMILEIIQFQLGMSIPVGNSSARELERNMILGMASIGGGIALANAPVPTSTSTNTTTTSRVSSVKTKNPDTNRLRTSRQYVTKETETSTRVFDNTEQTKQIRQNMCFNTALDSLRSMHYNVSSSTPNNPMILMNMPLDVVLVITKPRIMNPDYEFGYDHLFGRPLGKIKVLSSISGYTEITDIHIETAHFNKITTEERNMLEDILKSGIILPNIEE